MPTPQVTERHYGAGGKPLPRRWAPRPTPEVRIERAKKPLDFTAAMTALIADIARRMPEFGTIDVTKMLIGFTAARTRRKFGLHARVTPMKFRDGAEYAKRRGRLYRAQNYYRDGVRILYLVEFSLPRFLEQPFPEKLSTVIHELYHISPAFDGDVRRHGGRYEFHTHSQKGYDAEMDRMARRYLVGDHDAAACEFLHPPYSELWSRHGGVYGCRYPRPKLLPVTTIRG